MTKTSSGPKTDLPATTISVTSLDHPILKSFGQAELVRWKKEYDAYRKVLAAKCKSKGQRLADHIVSWKNCCDGDLLRTACEFDWRIDHVTITEKDLQERLTAIMEKTSSKTTESVDAINKCFRTLRMPKMTEDVTSVRRDYMCQVRKIIDERALGEALKVKATRRIVIKAITEKIEPAWVKNAVSRRLEANPADSLLDFADVLLSKLEAYQDFRAGQEINDIATGKRKQPDAQPGGGDGPPSKQPKPKPGAGKDPIKPKPPGHDGARDPAKKQVQPGGSRRQCWACKATDHELWTCPVVTDPDEREAVAGKFRNQMRRDIRRTRLQLAKAKAKAPAAPTKISRAAKPRTNPLDMSTHWITLCSKLRVPYCPDTGADENIIPRSMIDKLKQLQPDLKVVPLDPPMRGIGCNEAGFVAKDCAQIKLQLHTAAGPVNIPGPRTCYVVDDGDEFLLSNATLKSIGIDIDRLLEQLAVRQFDEDGDDLEPEEDDWIGRPTTRRASLSSVQPVRQRLDLAAMTPTSDPSSQPISGSPASPGSGPSALGGSDKAPTSTAAPGTRRHATSDSVTDATNPRRLDPELVAALKLCLDDATAHGLPQQYRNTLWRIVTKHDIWRLQFDPVDPPAKVPPMDVQPKPDFKPTRCKGRKLSPLEVRFLNLYCGLLLDADVLYGNPNSKWCSAVHPILKAEGRAQLHRADEWTDDEVLSYFRLTIDYRMVNSQTVPAGGTMPFQSTMVANLAGMNFMATFDQPKCFWQYPASTRTQQMLSIMVNGRVLSSKRVTQGHVDSALYVQATQESCYADLLYKHLLIWIDDLLLYAKTIEEFLTVLEQFLATVAKFGFKLSPTKTKLFRTEVKWCGRILNGDGVKHDPDRVKSLCDIPYPTNAGELQQFTCATNWMREAMIDYARIVHPLQQRLTVALAGTGRKNTTAKTIDITLSDTEKAAFDAVKRALLSMVLLAHPKAGATLCLICDASDTGWSIIITQVVDYDEDKPVQEQLHELLVCLSGMFVGAQLNWSVIEKEAYPIVRACLQLDYLLLRPQGFRLFCDHKNLIHIFAPDQEWKAYTRGKMARWAGIIGSFRYVIEHIDGVHNLWADMMSRWGQQRLADARRHKILARRSAVDTRSTKRRRTHETQFSPQALRPLDADGFVWPTLQEIRQNQEDLGRGLRPAKATLVNDVWCLDGRLWMPEGAVELLQRILVIGHCGSMGHRGVTALYNVVRNMFFVTNLKALCQEFVSKCLLCSHVKGPRIIQRPYAPLWHARRRNEGLHFDFLFLDKAANGFNYVLLLKDDLTHFCELVPCVSPTSEVCATAIMDWAKRFGMPLTWISDQGSHFKNELMAILATKCKARHDFVLAYCPWRNGTIERLNRDLLQVLRVLLREYRLALDQWDYLLPVVQANLNHTALPSLGNKSPTEVFTLLEPTTPLDVILGPDRKTNDKCDWTQGNIPTLVANLRTSLHEMHRQILDINREREARKLLSDKKVQVLNATAGDFVLWSRVDAIKQPKLSVTWLGPYRVTQVDAFSVEIEHLLTKDRRKAHSSRIKYYSDSDLNVTEEILDHVSEQGVLLKVAAIDAHRHNKAAKTSELHVQWEGLEAIEASWEPFASMLEQCPDLVSQYVDSLVDGPARRRLARMVNA